MISFSQAVKEINRSSAYQPEERFNNTFIVIDWYNHRQ